MPAVILGGATSDRLARAGWAVDVTGRSPGLMPDELAEAGVRFHRKAVHSPVVISSRAVYVDGSD
jgi:hypothetical protein